MVSCLLLEHIVYDLQQMNFVLILNSLNVSLSLPQEPQELLKLFSQAERGIYSVPYHMNKELIPVFVNICAKKYVLLTN